MLSMSKKILSAKERGITRTDWLQGRHVFSFGNFYDRNRMGVGPLIVFNDDIIAPSSGFSPHPHRDMEIVTIVLKGELDHRDSTGGVGRIYAGGIQLMSAGQGIVHSEFNAHASSELHLLQIWIRPRHLGGTPKYADHVVGIPSNQWLKLVGEGTDRVLDQEVTFYRTRLGQEEELILPESKESQSLFFYVIEGTINVGGQELSVGDALALEAANKKEINKFKALKKSDVLAIALYE